MYTKCFAFSPRKSLHGFTLVELLVVIAIIALLIGLLLPALARAKELAHTIACASNERQIALATLMWSNEHEGFAPGSAVAGALEYNTPNSPGIGQYLWGTHQGVVAGSPQEPNNPPGVVGWPWGASFTNRGQSVLVTRGYLSSPAVFICPSSNVWAPTYMSQHDPFIIDAFGYVDYRFNMSIVGDATSAIFGLTDADMPSFYDNPNYFPYNNGWGNIPGNPSVPFECPRMGTATDPSGTMLLEDGVSTLDFCSTIWPLPANLNIPDASGKFGQIGNAVHNGFKDINVAFLDGHVATVPKTANETVLPDPDAYWSASPGSMAYYTYFLAR